MLPPTRFSRRAPASTNSILPQVARNNQRRSEKTALTSAVEDAKIEELEMLLASRQREADRALVAADENVRLLRKKEAERVKLEAQLSSSDNRRRGAERAMAAATRNDQHVLRGCEQRIEDLEIESEAQAQSFADELSEDRARCLQAGQLRLKEFEEESAAREQFNLQQLSEEHVRCMQNCEQRVVELEIESEALEQLRLQESLACQNQEEEAERLQEKLARLQESATVTTQRLRVSEAATREIETERSKLIKSLQACDRLWEKPADVEVILAHAETAQMEGVLAQEQRDAIRENELREKEMRIDELQVAAVEMRIQSAQRDARHAHELDVKDLRIKTLESELALQKELETSMHSWASDLRQKIQIQQMGVPSSPFGSGPDSDWKRRQGKIASTKARKEADFYADALLDLMSNQRVAFKDFLSQNKSDRNAILRKLLSRYTSTFDAVLLRTVITCWLTAMAKQFALLPQHLENIMNKAVWLWGIDSAKEQEQSVFHAWSAAVDQRKTDYLKMRLAKDEHLHHVLDKALMGWSDVETAVNARIIVSAWSALVAHRHGMLKQALLRWGANDDVLIRVCFHAWTSWVAEARVTSQFTRKLENVTERALMRWNSEVDSVGMYLIWRGWCEAIATLQMEVLKGRLCKGARLQNALDKAACCWILGSGSDAETTQLLEVVFHLWSKLHHQSQIAVIRSKTAVAHTDAMKARIKADIVLGKTLACWGSESDLVQSGVLLYAWRLALAQMRVNILQTRLTRCGTTLTTTLKQVVGREARLTESLIVLHAWYAWLGIGSLCIVLKDNEIMARERNANKEAKAAAEMQRVETLLHQMQTVKTLAPGVEVAIKAEPLKAKSACCTVQ